MKNPAELLRHLKFALTAAIKGSQSFADVKTKDSLGSEAVLRYMGDTPQAGMPVTIVTPEGELPAPSGDYIAEDGSTIKVTDGVIMEIAPAAPVTDPNAQAAATPPATVENQSNPANATQPAKMEPKAIIESIVKEQRFKEVVIEAMKETIDAKDKELADQKVASDKEIKDLKDAITKQEGIIKQTFELVEKLAAKPAADSDKKKKDGFKKITKDELTQSVEAFRTKHGL